MLPPRALIGMVHTGALPGSPGHRLAIGAIVAQAVAEARILAETGFDAIIVENMHDRPYVNTHAPATTAAMTIVVARVREAVGALPLGVQVLSSGEREAISIAQSAGAQFIRCENFVFAHVADEGLMPDAKAGPLLRYRASVGASDIRIFADLKKKHASHALTSDISLGDAAEAAEFFSADGVIVTGTSTGKPTSIADVAEVKAHTRLPVLVGSGVTPEDVSGLFAAGADAVIVGSFIKQGGHWSSPVDRERCEIIRRAWRR